MLEMKNVIAKIFSGEFDSEVHSDFVKFSRGVFENRYLLEGKKQKDKWGVKTSSEFANFLVRRCLEKFGGRFDFKGAIIYTKYLKAFYALSFSGNGFELKIKAKPPKSGKPGKKGEDEPKADFCSLKTSDLEIIKDLFFDFSSFKEIRIKHTLEIRDIEIPKNYKTPEEMRELAKRKGVVKRFIDVDGQKKVSEKEFAA